MLDSEKVFIKNKINPPYYGDSIIDRIDILEQINTSLKNYNVIFISSAAGYGKTTLLSSLCKKYIDNFCWLSLEKDENNNSDFFDYILFSFSKLEEDICKKIMEIKKNISKYNTKYLIYNFIEKIAEIKKNYIMIWDDFHNIDDQDTLDLVFFIIKNLPDNLKIIISSRKNNLNLNIKEIEIYKIDVIKDLSFKQSHIELLLDIYKKDINFKEKEIEDILKKTNGWIMGVKLILLGLKNNQKIKDFSGDISSLSDYFFQEVFFNLDESIQKFLLSTSLLDTFSYDIANYILDISNSDLIIRKIQKQNLFIESLDNIDYLFKYHDLFKNFLYNKLKRSKNNLIKELNLKIANWYFLNENTNMEIKYRFEAGDVDKTLEIMENKIYEKIDNSKLNIDIKYIIKKIDFDKILDKPFVTFYYAWILYLNDMNFNKSKEILNLLQNKYPELDDKIKSYVFLLESCLSYSLLNFNESKLFAETAISLNPNSKNILIEANKNIAIVNFFSDKAKCIDSINKILTISDDFKDITRGINFKILLLLRDLKISEAKNESFELLKRFEKQNLLDYYQIITVYINYLHYYYYLDNYEKIKFYSDLCFKIVDHYKEIDNSISFNTVEVNFLSYYIEISIDYLDFENATKYINYLENKFLEAKNTVFEKKFNQLKIKYFLAKDDMKKIDYIYKNNSDVFYEDNLTLNSIHIKYLIRNNDFNKAEKILLEFLSENQEKKYKVFVFEARLFQAIIYLKKFDSEHCLFILTEITKSTQKENIIRIFTEIDDDFTLLPIFKRLLKKMDESKKKEIDTLYLEKIIKAFEVKIEKLNFKEPKQENILNILSQREKEIFFILIQDKTNKEIANILSISENTVKTHIKNIYKTLNVSDRTQLKFLSTMNT
ncbi:MAG: LuxR C-terminal-related transcriptional regulator [Cyanobacteriota bacterium]